MPFHRCGVEAAGMGGRSAAQGLIFWADAVGGEAELGYEFQDVGTGNLVEGRPHWGIFRVASGAGVKGVDMLLDVVEA